MDTDFSAAHSMDTLWFAVDQVGHVGLFTTGENGHAPLGTVEASEAGEAGPTPPVIKTLPSLSNVAV